MIHVMIRGVLRLQCHVRYHTYRTAGVIATLTMEFFRFDLSE